jgi:GH18 family chitinase
VCENGFGGIMSWDLATDVDVTHEMSLLKAVKEELDYYANPTVE